VCLGATAAQALLGRSFRVTQDRGLFVESPLAPFVMATVHPSSMLRAPDDAREEAMRAFIADLRKVAKVSATGCVTAAVRATAPQSHNRSMCQRSCWRSK